MTTLPDLEPAALGAALKHFQDETGGFGADDDYTAISGVIRAYLAGLVKRTPQFLATEDGEFNGNEADESEPKPCPFCGGDAERLELTDEDNFGGSVICCKGCGASSPVHFDRKENLLDSWNRRAARSAPEAGKAVTDAMVKRATQEFLSHRGERPERIKRGGYALWEENAPAMRAALLSALASVPAPSGAERVDTRANWRTFRDEPDSCPICAQPFKPDDLCSTDIDMGICHAECLKGSPIVNLDTGEPIDGPIPTYRYDDDRAPQAVPAEDVAGLVERLKLCRTKLGDEAAAALTSLSAERDRQREHISKQAEDIMTLGRLVYPKDGIGSDDTWKARCAASEAEATSLRRKLEETEYQRDEWKASHSRVVDGFMEVCEAVGVQFDAPEAVASAINTKIGNAEHGLRAAEQKMEEHRKALEPFGKDADNWADSVPDEYRPRCTEPGNEYAHPGSESAFSVGDLRRARTLSGASE